MNSVIFSQNYSYSIGVLIFILLYKFGRMMDLVPYDYEVQHDLKPEHEPFKILVVQLLKDEDNCKNFKAWSYFRTEAYIRTTKHCDHGCNLVSDLYIMNRLGDGRKRIVKGGKCRSGFSITKKCMCQVQNQTMEKPEWQPFKNVVEHYLGDKILNKTFKYLSTDRPVSIMFDTNFDDPDHPWNKYYQ